MKSKCIKCDSTFEKKSNNQKYCSVECKNTAYENYCLWCGKKFESHTKDRKYCSNKCVNESNKLQKNQRKYTCKRCNKKFKYKHNSANIYCSRECAFEDLSFHSTLRNLVKTLKKIKVIECEHCRIEFKTIRNFRYCSDECARLHNNMMNANRTRVSKKKCKTCGTEFETEYKGISYTYCSEECERESVRKRRRESKQKRKYKKKVLKRGGKYDNSITLDRLIDKYNNVCYLCGDECDSNDYTITEEGYFVVGPKYPSIEHVHPISKGGSHTWDNVNLAHCGCNSYKNDVVLFDEKGQMKLTI